MPGSVNILFNHNDLLKGKVMSEDISLFDAMYNCRAMRKLDTRDVPEELLIKLIDAANQAPSGSNKQSGRWLVVRDGEIKQKLADLNRAALEGYLGPQLTRPETPSHQSEDKHIRMFDAVIWQMEHLHELPALIVACIDFEQPVSPQLLAQGAGSIWPGVQNLLLAARACGLGAAPTNAALMDYKAAQSVLKLPDSMAAYCLIPVGYPLGKFGPVTRKPVQEIMRFDSWS